MDLDTGHRRNNFDFLRIVAALMVLFGHGYVLSGRGDVEPLIWFTGLGGFGELGVSIFFVISGFLVAASFERLPNVAAYVASRMLRILPGLAVAVALSAFLLGPLVSTLPPQVYFSQAQTWLYPVLNLALYPVTYELPGVFLDNPFPAAVNGSLWTLRLEFTCYLLIPALAMIGRFDRRTLAALALLAALTYIAVWALGTGRVPAIVLLAARNGLLFVAGAALYAWREAAWMRSPVAALLAAVALVVSLPSETFALLVMPLTLPLVVIGFALRPLPGISSWSRYGDYSYGLYIYAFPVQQLWMDLLGPGLGVGAFTALTLVCVVPLAVASWLLVEKPALDAKGWVRARLAGAGVVRARAAAPPG